MSLPHTASLRRRTRVSHSGLSRGDTSCSEPGSAGTQRVLQGGVDKGGARGLKGPDGPEQARNRRAITGDLGDLSSGSESSEDTESEELALEDSPGLLSSGSDSESECQEGEPNTHTEISTMSFEELIELQNKVGTKQFYKATGRADTRTGARENERPHKNQPLEVSSKKSVPFLRKVVPVKKKMRRDPRFDDLSGTYKPEIFEQTYKFLDDIKKQEKEIVQKKLRKARNPELKEKLEQLIRRMDQQEEALQKKQKQRAWEQEFKKQQRELAQQGKKPFYMKRGDIRRLELADKYQELKKRGKLEHFLSKKRKRNSHKDRRRLPNV